MGRNNKRSTGYSRSPAPVLSTQQRKALEVLLEAHDAATAVGRERRQFAVQLTALGKEGVSDTALRWLVIRGYAEHLRESTRQRGRKRTMQLASNLRFTERSCFMLTNVGAGVARQSVPQGQERNVGSVRSARAITEIRPGYVVCEDGTRELRVGDRLVKRFRGRITNQELILVALQEQGWPRRTDDALPPRGTRSPKLRLRDTIGKLNRRQVDRLIRFHGDGTGQGVNWELLDVSSRPATGRQQATC